MHTYIHTYIQTYKHTDIHSYIPTYACMYIHAQIHMYIHMQIIYTYVYLYIYMYTHIYIYTRPYTYTSTYTCICIYIYIGVHICLSCEGEVCAARRRPCETKLGPRISTYSVQGRVPTPREASSTRSQKNGCVLPGNYPTLFTWERLPISLATCLLAPRDTCSVS